MDWYLVVLRKYADFNGRAQRAEYWMFALFNGLISLGLILLGMALFRRTGSIGWLLAPLVLYIAAVFIPGLAVTVRRFHDTGKSGWLVLLFWALGLVPFVNLVSSIIQIVFLCTDSTPRTNQYGPCPKSLPDVATSFASF